MILLVAFYEETNTSRRGEFLECLRRNAANRWIDEIHLFVEEPRKPAELAAAYPILADRKLRLVAHGRRVTYHDLFAYANRCLTGRRVIIANADIYFDQTLARLHDVAFSNRLLCLSRWDVQPDGTARFFDHSGSQDAWIFEAPMRAFACDFHLGLPGCDNRLAAEAARAGLELANPARSVRALHLHLSLVRHYGEHNRVAGPVLGVEATTLGTPWLWFVVSCMGRLDDLRRTIGTLVDQPQSSTLLVDYTCPDESGAWAQGCWPELAVVRVADKTRYRGADARNRGAAAVPDGGILCFLDADIGADASFASQLHASFREDGFLVPDQAVPGLGNCLVCSKAAFDRVGGFDATFLDWGEESEDLKGLLRRAGYVERTFPAALLSPLDQRQRTAHDPSELARRQANRAIHGAYRRVKTAILDETAGNGLPESVLRDIYAAITRRHLVEHGLTLNVPCAVVAFRETMGYTVARLQAGISSHNNDRRPFVSIPAPLLGLQFTQVVASLVSPVEVELLSAGKVYVLVGTDWDGCHTARAWLSKVGYREDLPPVETSRGTGFEVWSLVGDCGTSYVVPTQVMLVAAQLRRK